MDILSVCLGFILGALCAANFCYERYFAHLEKEDRRTIHVKAHTQLVMFVPRENMKNCRFVGIERGDEE